MDFLEKLQEKINKNWIKIVEEQEELNKKNKNKDITPEEDNKGEKEHD